MLQVQHPHPRLPFPGTLRYTLVSSLGMCNELPFGQRLLVAQSSPCAPQVAWGADHRIVLDFPLLINCAPRTLALWSSPCGDVTGSESASAELLCAWLCRYVCCGVGDDRLWRIHWEGEPDAGIDPVALCIRSVTLECASAIRCRSRLHEARFVSR